MNNITDNAFVPNMDAPETDYFEDTDTIADADGVEFRTTGGQGAEKQTTPDWVSCDFDWRSFTDKETGEVNWRLSPRAASVEAIAKQAPQILEDGIENMSDDDHEVARQLASDLQSLMETASVVDGYLESAIPRFFMNHMAKNCIFTASRAESASSWSDRLKKDEPEPEKLTEMVSSILESTTKAAIMRSALLQVAPTETVNFKSAAWDVYKWKAYSYQNRFMNPDEASNRVENTKEATKSLLGRLRKRHAA